MFSKIAERSFLPALAVAAIVASLPVHAQQADTRTMTVRYADLDLATADGAAALRQRIERAATNVCGPFDIRSLADGDRFAACRAKAVEGALPKAEATIASAKSASMYAMNEADTTRGR
jgi:UrcA family protein